MIFTRGFSIIVFYTIIILIINILLFCFVPSFFYKEADISTKQNIDRIVDGTYFTFTEISTIGFGDITPQTNWAKMIIVAEQIGLLFVTFNAIPDSFKDTALGKASSKLKSVLRRKDAAIPLDFLSKNQ